MPGREEPARSEDQEQEEQQEATPEQQPRTQNLTAETSVKSPLAALAAGPPISLPSTAQASTQGVPTHELPVQAGLEQPLTISTSARTPTPPQVVSAALVFCLGVGYLCASSGMIAFNKYLMNPGRFPFASTLVLLHALFSFVCALFLFIVRPSFFPSLTDPERKVAVNASLLWRGVFPVAALFSCQLILSNTAYLHLSTAFLQMMKEANLVLVYVMSLAMVLEVFDWTKCRVLVMIVIATLITIRGELNFSLTGFIIQGSGQLMESAKIVMQSLLLSPSGKKLDVMTYMLLVMPMCFAVLGGALMMLTYVTPMEHFKTPRWKDMVAWWPVLLANACVAFTLNIVIALFIKYSSAVGFILAGIAKDAFIVIVGSAFLGEIVSSTQVMGFMLQLLLITLWSMMKLFPDRFEEGIMPGVHWLTRCAMAAGTARGGA